ncbi:MAG: hypothetical protein AAFV38_10620, partial [Pseudomonadota bacterium]
AAFDQLGRTDKSEAAMAVSAFDTIESDSNVQGRYSVHFHRTGVDDPVSPGCWIKPRAAADRNMGRIGMIN